jgi:hypothetical protein
MHLAGELAGYSKTTNGRSKQVFDIKISQYREYLMLSHAFLFQVLGVKFLTLRLFSQSSSWTGAPGGQDRIGSDQDDILAMSYPILRETLYVIQIRHWDSMRGYQCLRNGIRRQRLPGYLSVKTMLC